MAPKMTYFDFTVQAIASIYRRTKKAEMAVKVIWVEAETQSKKVKFGFSPRARGTLVKGLIILRGQGILVFSRDDNDAGRWEDDNSVVLTGEGIALVTQLLATKVQEIGPVKPEGELSETELRRLHASRQQRLRQLLGRVSVTLNIIQLDRKIRRLGREKAEAEDRAQELEDQRWYGRLGSAAPVDTRQELAGVATGTSDMGGSSCAGDIISTPGREPLSGPSRSRTERHRRASPITPAPFRAPLTPLRRAHTFSGSSFYGRQAGPFVGRPIPQDPATPRAPHTPTSSVPPAYPTPVSATRPKIALNRILFGTSPRNLQVDDSPGPSDLLNSTIAIAKAGGALFAYWPRLGSLFSREGQDARRRSGQREEGLQEQTPDREACIACLEKDEEIGFLREGNEALVKGIREHREQSGNRIDKLLSENASRERGRFPTRLPSSQ